MKERIWINRVSSELVFQSLHPDSAPLHDELIIAVRGVQWHLMSYQRVVSAVTLKLSLGDCAPNHTLRDSLSRSVR